MNVCNGKAHRDDRKERNINPAGNPHGFGPVSLSSSSELESPGGSDTGGSARCTDETPEGGHVGSMDIRYIYITVLMKWRGKN